MIKIWKGVNFLIVIFLILICLLGTFYKHISFGLGLGDIIFGYIPLYFITITHIYLTIILRKKGTKTFILLSSIFLTLTLFICLKATLWRGPQYRWNGNIFYIPCGSKINIRNQNINKTVLVEMCTGDYISEFTAEWDGKFMKIVDGNLNLPKKLNKYIDYPIKHVKIETEIFKNYNGVVDYVKIDTLKINHQYKLKGKIIKIQNKIPVIKVTIY